jgi:hypothetical protein
MPLHYYRSLISDMFRILGFMNYPFPTRRDMQTTRDTLYRFGSTDHISAVSWYVYWIEVNGNRDDLVRIPEANWQRRVATPTNEKSYGLKIYELQIQKRHELSTQSRLTVVKTIQVDTRGQPGKGRVSDQVSRSQLQRIHHTRTRRLSIAGSMRSDKLPPNWDNWRWQGRFQIAYVPESHVTGNAEAGPFPEISLILIRQAQSKLRRA